MVIVYLKDKKVYRHGLCITECGIANNGYMNKKAGKILGKGGNRRTCARAQKFEV